MYNPSLKPLLIGIGIGVVLFVIPWFLLKAALFFLLFGALFRFVSRRLYWSRHPGYHGRPPRAGWRYVPFGYGAELHPAFADTIRNMSEEEYDTFRQKLTDERSYHPETNHKTTIEIQ